MEGTTWEDPDVDVRTIILKWVLEKWSDNNVN